MPNRKQNIENIANACATRKHTARIISGDELVVGYRGFHAVYDISGSRPVFTPSYPNSMTTTNQFIIDGMRLAAQRVIDKRSEPRTVTFSHAPGKGEKIEITRIIFDEASDLKSEWFMFDEAPTRDPLSLKIQSFATASFNNLALEYMAAKDRRRQAEQRVKFDPVYAQADYDRDQKIMDLADDIACARFGVGFYVPSN